MSPPYGDSTSPPSSRVTRLARSQQALLRGTVSGRVRQAAPVPERDDMEIDSGGGTSLYVGPDDPGVGNYDFWFDTDEAL